MSIVGARPPPQMTYAPPPPWHRRRLQTRWLVVAVLLSTVATFPAWVRPAWSRLAALYWQRRCLGFETAHPSVVLRYGQQSRPEQTQEVPPWPGEAARQWASLCELFGPIVSTPVAFLHERRTPSGASRLVAVGVFPDDCNRLSFVTWVVRPGDLRHRPVEVTNSCGGGVIVRSGSGRVESGYADPIDSSHLVIRVTTTDNPNGEQVVVIDGWLRDDDTVVLDVRQAHGGLTLAPPPGTPRRTVAP